mmetsp:Transcript_10777/g.20002  ORF Transcript_10777/g.20002 Transcript_10777/m.20002 type:complete len:232 (+) Transcript_10777:646-1341(+)
MLPCKTISRVLHRLHWLNIVNSNELHDPGNNSCHNWVTHREVSNFAVPMSSSSILLSTSFLNQALYVSCFSPLQEARSIFNARHAGKSHKVWRNGLLWEVVNRLARRIVFGISGNFVIVVFRCCCRCRHHLAQVVVHQNWWPHALLHQAFCPLLPKETTKPFGDLQWQAHGLANFSGVFEWRVALGSCHAGFIARKISSFTRSAQSKSTEKTEVEGCHYHFEVRHTLTPWT